MANEKTKEKAGEIADFIFKILKDTAGVSSDVARNLVHAILDKPYIGMLIGKLSSASISWIKAGGLTKFIADFAAAKQAGASLKVALKDAVWKSSVSARGFAQAGKVGKVGTVARGTLKVAAIIAALQVAKKTTDAAAAAWDHKWDKFKNNQNFKTGWELFWETSIPVATYRWIESAIKGKDIHATPWTDTKTSQPTPSGKSLKEAVYDRLNVTDKGEPNKVSVYTGYNYDEAAKSLGLSPRPSHPQAENEWKKEVDRQMNKVNRSKINDKSWYERGEAAKIMAGTLTWSAVKTNSAARGYPFVAASAASVNILMPMEDKKIHPRIKQNINVLFQALRGKNTGAYQYNEEDVFNYVYCLSSLIARLRYAQKVLRLANVHDVLVDAVQIALTDLALDQSVPQGNTYKDIISNAPNYISRINACVEELNTYALPGNTLISRWNYIADKGFKDYNGKQAVYCFYRLNGYPRFSRNSSSTPLACAYIGNLNPNTPFDSFLSDIESDIHDFRTLGAAANNDWTIPSNVMVKISGDMIKLLGAKESTFKNVPYYTGNPVQSFDYDVEAIDQLRNGKIWAMTNSDYANYNSAYDIRTLYQSVQSGDDLLNFVQEAQAFHDNWIVTSERNIQAVGAENVQLLQFFWNADIDVQQSPADYAKAWAEMTDCSATILNDIIHAYYVPGATWFAYINSRQFLSMGTTNRLNINTFPSADSDIEIIVRQQVDYIPQPELIADAAGVHPVGQMIDVDNYAYVSKRQFKELNNVAAYSLTYYWDPAKLNINGII